MSLGSKVALITGASQGMAVAVNVRSDKAEQVAQALRQQGYQAQAFIADISRKAEVEATLEQVEAQPGPLWLLVNKAGLLRKRPAT
jgi:NAD(P)-dependent dehydrogenase (short-subunit alcohol dehydrogenase family)